RSSFEATAVKAKALHEAAVLSWQAGEPPEKGEAFYQESLAIYRKLGSKRELALLLRGEEGVALAREVGDKTILAQRLHLLGLHLRDQLDWERMEAVATEGLALHQELGNTIGVAASYRLLGLAPM